MLDTIIDRYDVSQRQRNKRSKGVEELYEIVEDIKYCNNRVYKISQTRIGRFFKVRKFHRLIRKQLKSYEQREDIPYMHIAIQHQAYNDALEEMLKK